MTEQSKPVQKKRIGRPPGSKNKKTLALERLATKALKDADEVLYRELVPILRAQIKKALDGDTQAAKLVLDRVMPARRLTEGDAQRGDVLINLTVTHGTRDGVTINGQGSDPEPAPAVHRWDDSPEPPGLEYLSAGPAGTEGLSPGDYAAESGDSASVDEER